MSEAELFQAYYNSIGMAYTSSQWWITVSTALIVATYFAAKHIPHWLFGVIILLYLLSATSAIIETSSYSGIATLYGVRLSQTWSASQTASPFVGGRVGGAINTAANISVLVLGTLAAVAYSFVTWRAARTA
jgi:hypothetical protein